ncbi:MAG TPA: gluconate 2-dehydrogenase subunit 3 family protein [Actinomycetota bacterium]
MTEPTPDAAATLRAAAEVFVPGSDRDLTPGAPDVAAELFISHYLDFMMPGLAEGVPTLLDEIANARFGAAFASLELGQREQVLDAIATHEVEQLRDIPTALGILSIAAVYGEWTGQDAEGNLIRRPLGWQLARFEGPTRARPNLMREP